MKVPLHPKLPRIAALELAFALTCVGAAAAAPQGLEAVRAPFPPFASEAPARPTVEVDRAPRASTRAQRDTESAPLPDLQLVSESRFEHVHHDVTADGTLWARGRDYKAAADPGGFRFIPFLGSDAPQNYPVHFELADVRRGDRSLELAPLAEASVDGDCFVLDRGSVEVRYDLSVEHAEQSFALAVPPGTGDLVLTLDVETELALELRDGALRYANERGGVDYGAAIAFDAAGRRTTVETRTVPGGLELVVPGRFLERATGPIVVDPILSTFVIDDIAIQFAFPDAAYDVTNERYWVTYQEVYSSQDDDVYSVYVDATTGAVSGGAYVNISGASWTSPSVAILRGVGKYMVVGHAPSVVQAGSTDLVARMRNVADGTFEPEFVLKGATTFYGCQFADVGGEGVDLTATNFLVTYERDYGTDIDALGIVVDPDGNFVGNELTLSTGINFDERFPRVSKSTGTLSGDLLYSVTWVLEDLNAPQSKVQGARVAFDGTIIGPKFDVLPWSPETYLFATPSEPSAFLHAPTGEQYWMAAIQVAVPIPNSNFISANLEVALIAGDEILDVDNLQQLEHATDFETTQGLPVITTTGSSFQVAYPDGSFMRVTTLQPVAGQTAVREGTQEITGNNEAFMVAGASRYSGGDFGAFDSLLTWARRITLVGASTDIVGALVSDDQTDLVAGYQYCYGEPLAFGPAGLIQAFGDRSRFSPQEIVLSQLTPNAFCILVASRTPGLSPNPLGFGNLCLSGDIGRSGVLSTGTQGVTALVLDPTAIPQPTGPVAAGVETWYFQAWYRDFDGGSPSSNFTNGLAIEFQ